MTGGNQQRLGFGGSDGGPAPGREAGDDVVPDDIWFEARRAIEAMLLVASEPTDAQLMAQVVELPAGEVTEICRTLAAEYERERRGFQLVEVAGGWRYQTHPDLHPYVERYALEGIPTRLSTAALETMAIVAYKQPISRAQIGAIRGVNVDGVLRTLQQRGYVEEVGRDDGPGQAILFGTTTYFLERLGLHSLDQLPVLGDFVPSAAVVEALEQTLRFDDAEPDDAEPDEGDADGDRPEADVEQPGLGFRVEPGEIGLPDGADRRDVGGTEGAEVVEQSMPEADEPGP